MSITDDKHKVSILLIDEGKIREKSVKITKFYKLPEELAVTKVPRMTADVVLMNIRPKDLHPTWPKVADELMSQTLMEGRLGLDREFKCRSKFLFSLNDTFWVTHVQGLEKLESQGAGIKWTPIFDIGGLFF